MKRLDEIENGSIIRRTITNEIMDIEITPEDFHWLIHRIKELEVTLKLYSNPKYVRSFGENNSIELNDDFPREAQKVLAEDGDKSQN